MSYRTIGRQTYYRIFYGEDGANDGDTPNKSSVDENGDQQPENENQ
jgi:hypothetical protein